MKNSISLWMAAIALMTATGLQAQTVVTWNSGAITGDSNIIPASASAIVLDAYGFTGPNATPAPGPFIVNGVSFSIAPSTAPGPNTFGDVTATGLAYAWSAWYSPSQTGWSSLSAGMQGILQGNVMGNNTNSPGAPTITVANLTVGSNYTVEFLLNEPFNGVRTETLEATSDSSTAVASEGGSTALGSWVTANFTAQSTSEAFQFYSTYDPVIDAIEVVQNVPEPTTYALFAAGAALIGAMALRRSRLAAV